MKSIGNLRKLKVLYMSNNKVSIPSLLNVDNEVDILIFNLSDLKGTVEFSDASSHLYKTHRHSTRDF